VTDPCHQCDGTGRIEGRRYDQFGLHVGNVDAECPRCHGTGSEDRHTWTEEAAAAFERAHRPVEPAYDEAELDGEALAALYRGRGRRW
jgi:hypothetical protein